MNHFNADDVSKYYDQLGVGEWDRLAKSAHARLIFHLHWHFLKDYVGGGRQVLDAGCGAGRFAIPCAEAGSELTLLDLSPVQLRLAEEKIREHRQSAQLKGAVVGDLSKRLPFADGTFDTTFCFGGALNYIFQNAQACIDELCRVTKPGGTLLVSVNSRWGVFRFTAANDKLGANFFGKPDEWKIWQVADSGDLPALPQVDHPARHFFQASELRALFEKCRLEKIALGSAPAITGGFYSKLEALAQDPESWKTIIGLEERAYQFETLADSGEFLLARGTVAGH
jgi:SAM-dependent methyltransferase